MSEDRALPHASGSERAILGAVLLDNCCFGVAESAGITATDFSNSAHRHIWEAMLALFERDEPIDTVTLREQLGQRNQLQVVGGLAYISALIDGLPQPANVDHYVGHVKGAAHRRRLVQLAETLQCTAMDDGDWLQAVEQIQQVGACAGDRSEGVILVRASDVPATHVRWAWKDRIPLGGLTLLVGDPGLGKTTVGCERAARVTRGDLEGDLHGQPADVLIATAEDAHSVLRARLEAAGADLDRVHFVTVQRDGIDVGLTLPKDVAELERRATEVGVSMVLVDPIAGHLEGVDSHRDASLRRALAPLARMAETTDAAVVGVAHLNKSAAADLLRRVGGSVAMVAAARSVLLCTCDPGSVDDAAPERLLSHGKSNYGALAPMLRLRLEGREVETPDGPAPTVSVAWLGEVEGLTLADVLAPNEETTECPERDEAVDWLNSYLAEHNGEAPAGEVIEAARRDGITKSTLYRARKRAGVISAKSSFHGGWIWSSQRRFREGTEDTPAGSEKPSNSSATVRDDI